MANLKAKFYYFYNMSPDVYKYPHEEKNLFFTKILRNSLFLKMFFF